MKIRFHDDLKTTLRFYVRKEKKTEKPTFKEICLKEICLEKIKEQLVDVDADADLLLELELPELLKKQLHTEMLDCWTGAWYLKPEAKQNLAFTNKDKSHAWKVKYFDETED